MRSTANLDQLPAPLRADGSPPRTGAARRNWNFLLQLPTFGMTMIGENLGYFFWGRHAGFLLYMPFAALCILMLALEAPRD
ncbi:MAG: hypothetical protein R3344_05625, partial [Acidobacteriota bacterium]|nr:hypothetical protein [Acidobacteriota bacterium]